MRFWKKCSDCITHLNWAKSLHNMILRAARQQTFQQSPLNCTRTWRIGLIYFRSLQICRRQTGSDLTHHFSFKKPSRFFLFYRCMYHCEANMSLQYYHSEEAAAVQIICHQKVKSDSIKKLLLLWVRTIRERELWRAPLHGFSEHRLFLPCHECFRFYDVLFR